MVLMKLENHIFSESERLRPGFYAHIDPKQGRLIEVYRVDSITPRSMTDNSIGPFGSYLFLTTSPEYAEELEEMSKQFEDLTPEALESERRLALGVCTD